jgi:hypothetical protein
MAQAGNTRQNTSTWINPFQHLVQPQTQSPAATPLQSMPPLDSTSSTDTDSHDSFYSLSTQSSESTENLIRAFSSCIRVQEIQLKAQTSLIERQKENLDLQRRLVSAMRNLNAGEKKTEIDNELDKVMCLQTRISDFLEKILEQAEEAEQLLLQAVTYWGHLTKSGQEDRQDDGEPRQQESDVE